MLAIAEAERLAGCPLEQALADPVTGEVRKIKLVTDNGPAFKGAAFARFIAGRTEFVHIRTRRRSPGQNGVRERAFGSLEVRAPVPDRDRRPASPGPRGRALPADL